MAYKQNFTTFKNVHGFPAPKKTSKFGTLIPNRIFVGGLSTETSEDELLHIFSNYGTILSVKVILDRFGRSKGYGFVTFQSEVEAKRLTTDPDGVVLRDRKLNIQPAVRKNIAPSINGNSLYRTDSVAANTGANNHNLNNYTSNYNYNTGSVNGSSVYGSVNGSINGSVAGSLGGSLGGSFGGSLGGSISGSVSGSFSSNGQYANNKNNNNNNNQRNRNGITNFDQVPVNAVSAAATQNYLTENSMANSYGRINHVASNEQGLSLYPSAYNYSQQEIQEQMLALSQGQAQYNIGLENAWYSGI